MGIVRRRSGLQAGNSDVLSQGFSGALHITSLLGPIATPTPPAIHIRFPSRLASRALTRKALSRCLRRAMLPRLAHRRASRRARLRLLRTGRVAPASWSGWSTPWSMLPDAPNAFGQRARPGLDPECEPDVPAGAFAEPTAPHLRGRSPYASQRPCSGDRRTSGARRRGVRRAPHRPRRTLKNADAVEALGR